jgi:hypothetical protein
MLSMTATRPGQGEKAPTQRRRKKRRRRRRRRREYYSKKHCFQIHKYSHIQYTHDVFSMTNTTTH